MSHRVAKLLYKQLQDLQKKPVDNVSAEPLEEDITEWHCNLYFPSKHPHFPNLILHFILNFEDDYPSSSPQLRLCTNLAHSHVFFPSICFSLLGDYRGYFESCGTPKTAFWNPTRTVRSFLEDLSVFLLNDEDEHVSITASIRDDITHQARRFRCTGCEHTFMKPSPALMEGANMKKGEASTTAVDEKELDDVLQKAKDAVLVAKPSQPIAFLRDYFIEMVNNPTSEVMNYTQTTTFVPFEASDKDSIPYDPQLIEDMRCGICGCNFYEGSNVMGFGVFNEGSHSGDNSDFSPLCQRCYDEDEIRVTAEGCQFTRFYPFYIFSSHFIKPANTLRRQLFCERKCHQLIKSLCEIWKNQAVAIGKGDVFVSERLLKNFCAVHHLMIGASMQHSYRIKAFVEQQINDFTRHPDNRTKARIPDLGVFLPLLLLSERIFDRKVYKAFVEELFTRNARWILRQYPQMIDPSYGTTTERLEKSFTASKTGLRLVLFQIRYMLSLPKWLQEEKSHNILVTEADSKIEAKDAKEIDSTATTATSGTVSISPQVQLFDMFNHTGSRPSMLMLEDFQNQTKRVQSLSNMSEFFGGCNLLDEFNTPEKALHLLNVAMERSEKLGYHNRQNNKNTRRSRW